MIQIRSAIDKYIKPNTIDCLLTEIYPQDIQKLLNVIPTTRTKKSVYGVLNGLFGKAIKTGLIKDNPMTAVDSIKHKSVQGRALTKNEEKHFLKIIEKHLHKSLYLFYLYTGCRRSEALSLQWSDIDFDNKLLRIRGTKTNHSYRTIPLFDNVINLLKSLPNKQSRVFNLSLSTVKSCFVRLQKKYNLNFRLHDLRHTFATRCLERGISMKTIQKWLGHSKLDTTANIYMHVLTSFELEEVIKMNKTL